MRNQTILISLIGFLFASGCYPEPEWNDLRGTSTDCLVAVFPPGATDQQVNTFLAEYTQGPPHPRGGFSHKDAVSAIVKREVDGQIAYEICFRETADPSEVSAIRESVKTSGVLARVIEGKAAEEAIYGSPSP